MSMSKTPDWKRDRHLSSRRPNAEPDPDLAGYEPQSHRAYVPSAQEPWEVTLQNELRRLYFQTNNQRVARG